MQTAAAPIRTGKTGRRPQSLYVVPERRVVRRRHLPAGRTLHLVDVENLMGGPTGGLLPLEDALAQYRSVAPVTSGDHIVIAANPALAWKAGMAWPTARLLAASGPDGADRALLAEVADTRVIAERFDRVIVGSGDGIFATDAESLRALGIAVGVVAPITGLSRHLYQRASFVRFLAPCPALRVIA